MSSFDASKYGTRVAEFLSEERINPLGPGGPNEAVRPNLEGLRASDLFGGKTIRDHNLAEGCRSALWLYHDFLDESHTISQGIQTPDGSYWHGIMHRREPDFSNSKHWFRKAGEHSIFAALREEAVEMAAGAPAHESSAFLTSQAAWDPYGFVDLCEACVNGRSPCEELARKIQRREWELLFDYGYRQALGG